MSTAAATERVITERQYEELNRYADGRPRWVNGGPLVSLVSKSYLVPSAHDPLMFCLTRAGTMALVRFRERYGIKHG